MQQCADSVAKNQLGGSKTNKFLLANLCSAHNDIRNSQSCSVVFNMIVLLLQIFITKTLWLAL